MPASSIAHCASLRDSSRRLGRRPDQEADRPGGVLGRRGGEVPRERRDLLVGLGGGIQRRVEFGEGLHDSGSSYRVFDGERVAAVLLSQRTSGPR